MKKRRNGRRTGGPRKQGPREPNGRILRVGKPRGPLVPVEVKMQRAKAVGVDVTKDGWQEDARVKDARSGTILGAMLLRGEITQRQYEAADIIGRDWRQYLGMAGIAGSNGAGSMLGQLAGGGAGRRDPSTIDWNPAGCGGLGLMTDTDADRWRSVCRRMNAARAAIQGTGRAWGLALSMVESIAVDDVMPPRLRGIWPEGWELLRGALDALADLYRLPKPAEQQAA